MAESSSPVSANAPDIDALPDLLSTLNAHAPTVRQTSAEQRKAKLRRLADALLSRREEIAEALKADFGKPALEVDLTEIKAVTKEVEFAISHLDDWMAPEQVSSPFLLTGTRSEIHYEPKGVVLIMSPWNYPVNLTLGPLVGAIAAGNCAVLKPSEHTPRTAALLKDLIADLYDEREITVVTGGPDVSEALTKQPFDHIYFTGSPAIGRHVMRAAADHLTSVTLELGGKSPALVDPTADLDQAAERIAWSKFTNAGQTCIAPDYVLVHDAVHDALVDRLRDTIHRFYGATPDAQRTNDDYARLVNHDHYEHIVRLLETAVGDGATVAAGGEHDADAQYVAPTLLTEVPLDTAMMQSEIFGPLLPIRSYDLIDDALRIVNDRPEPLSFYVFTERDATVDTVLTHTTAGSTCVNEGFLHFVNPSLPFGGKGESGIGRGHGRWSFREFSNERAVLRRTYGSAFMSTLYPPYDRLTSRITDWILRFF